LFLNFCVCAKGYLKGFYAMDISKVTLEELFDIEDADPDWLQSIGINWPKEEQTSDNGIEYYCDLVTISHADLYIRHKCLGQWVDILKNPNRGQVRAFLIAISDQCVTNPSCRMVDGEIVWGVQDCYCSRGTKGCWNKHPTEVSK
jgi:hypothetical protein